MKNVDVGWGPIGLNEIRSKHKKLKLNTNSITSELNSQFQILIESEYEETPIWKSLNEDVAVIDQNGNVTIVGYGVAHIIVTSGKLKGTCVIKVPEIIVPEPDPEPDPEPEPDIPTSKLDNTKIYYGTIQAPTFISYTELTEEEVVRAIEEGTLLTKPLSSIEETITVNNLGDAVVILIPSNKYTAYKDNGGGTKVIFDESASGSDVEVNGEVKLGDFYVYGEMMFLATGKLKIYVE